MKILHVINHTGRFNGNVHAAVDLACAQADAGHRVAVCHGGGDFDDTFAAHGVSSLVVSCRRRPVDLLKASMGILSILRRWRPDVIHAHMLTGLLVAFLPAKWHRKPLVATVHNAFERSAVAMGVAQKVISVSSPVAESLSRRGIPRSKIRVVLNGTIGSARRRSDIAVPELARPAILFVGGLHPRKGVGDLVRAFESFSRAGGRATLYIVGEGPCAGDYETQAGGTECAARIIFAGSQPDPFAFMLAADILVLPSLADPAPLVISEAREAGCAIIATKVDGIPELLGGGEAGLLVDPKAPEQIAAALSRLLGDPSELATWRTRSKRGSEQLSLKRVCSQSVSVYAECISERQSLSMQFRDLWQLAFNTLSRSRYLRTK